MSDHHPARPFLPRTGRRLSVPILLLWLALAATTNALVRQPEELGRTHNVAMNLADAPSLQATKRIGLVFGEFDPDSAAMVVLEGDKPLGADAHRFCDTMIHRLEQDRKHVKHVQDFWGDTLTAAASQSADGKAAYVQIYLAETWARRGPVRRRRPQDRQAHAGAAGQQGYVTGAAPLIADQFEVGSKGTAKVTAITVGVIAVMLLFVYRSLSP